MAAPRPSIETIIAGEIGATAAQVAAAVALLDGGATVPFVARYRKEATGGLDDIQLRALETRLGALRDLEARRATVRRSIGEQGKLTDVLSAAIDAARERGLGPLAERILADRTVDPGTLAAGFLNAEVGDVKAALEGARDIVAEAMAETPALVGAIRRHLVEKARLRARVVRGKEETGAKFSDYFDHEEKWAGAPSHRVLALLRAAKEGVIDLDVEVDAGDPSPVKPVEAMIARQFDVRTSGGSAADEWLMGVARWAWRTKIHAHVSGEMMASMKESADAEAIRVFARNLKDILLAAPAGAKTTMGLDPGIRTGVKVAVIDATGRLVETGFGTRGVDPARIAAGQPALSEGSRRMASAGIRVRSMMGGAAGGCLDSSRRRSARDFRSAMRCRTQVDAVGIGEDRHGNGRRNAPPRQPGGLFR